MSTFSASLTPTPAAGKAIPYDWFTKLLDNTLALKQGDTLIERFRAEQVDITTTGTVNDHNPDGMVVRWNGASQMTVNGVVAHGDGDIRVYENITSGQVLAFTHENAGSTAANRLILPSAQGVYLGEGGTIGLRYDGTSDRWRVLYINPGKSITVAHAGGNFTADGTTWTVDSADQISYHYQQRGSVVFLVLEVENSDVGGSTTNLRVTLPNSWSVRTNRQGRGYATLRDAGTRMTGQWLAVPGDTFVRFHKTDSTANFTSTSSDNTDVQATMELEVA